MIPANRIDPAARNIMNFFWPLPNQPGTIADGYGVFQQFVPVNARPAARRPARSTTRLSGNDSLFLRGSYQHRDPAGRHLRGRQRAHQPAASSRARSTPRP